VTQRLAHLFDLSARPEAINSVLEKDPVLQTQRVPGLRVPGAFDGFELAVRAILGQQITVKAATTLGGRFVEAFGEPIAAPIPELERLAPSPEKVATLTISDIAQLGIIRARANSILAVAEACATGRLQLEPGANPEAIMAQLTAIPGIGPWTAHYVAMRALDWPDAFPKEDIAVRNALGRVTPKQAEALSQRWRPWRSYAVLHLWRH
jgi:AraC family transcriptional regulator of adaptative response / DNA-3-methyladenine glycosylase II